MAMSSSSTFPEAQVAEALPWAVVGHRVALALASLSDSDSDFEDDFSSEPSFGACMESEDEPQPESEPGDEPEPEWFEEHEDLLARKEERFQHGHSPSGLEREEQIAAEEWSFSWRRNFLVEPPSRASTLTMNTEAPEFVPRASAGAAAARAFSRGCLPPPGLAAASQEKTVGNRGLSFFAFNDAYLSDDSDDEGSTRAGGSGSSNEDVESESDKSASVHQAAARVTNKVKRCGTSNVSTTAKLECEEEWCNSK